MTLYALMMKVCLLGGDCHAVAIEAYYDLEQCKTEAVHQIVQGMPDDALFCEVIEDEA